MKVLVLAPSIYNTSPGQRFRIEQWAHQLGGDGFEFTYAPFEDQALHRVLYQPGNVAKKVTLTVKALARRLRLLPRVNDFDVVYLFREASLVGPALIERAIARRRIPIVFDFDDAIWVPYVSPANRYLSYLKCFGKTATLCGISRHVLAGNPFLAAYARQYNRNVSIIPTTIDTDVYRVRPEKDFEKREPLTIGWTGSYSTAQHLDTLHGALLKLSQRHPFRLMTVGAPHHRMEGLHLLAKPWRVDSETSDLQQFDVGIMPLPDDDWTRGKCGLKLLQCMAVGVPVVGALVGVNADIIQDGLNGFLARSDDEWVEKLSLLLREPGLRREMGLRGRQTVEERYSGRAWAPRVAEILHSAVGGP